MRSRFAIVFPFGYKIFTDDDMYAGQKAMITKFRERWDKLKESAKRKKDAKAAAEAAKSGVRERIDEEPEAEVEEATA
jgi:hypothetical protein